MGHFNELFSAYNIGSFQLKNRIVMASMGNTFANEQGEVTDRTVAYYVERAKGGVGLINTEAMPVGLLGRHRLRCLSAYDDSFLPGLRRLVTSVHRHGSAIALQLHHAGRQANPEATGSPPQAPSPIPRWPGAPIPKEMSLEEIQQCITHFASAARRAKEAGFDAVEIHGANGYLIHTFLSPRTNKRKDSYGGSSENRLRFALEVLQQVRNEVGDSFPVLFRLSGKEYVEGGYAVEEALDWAKELERAGASAIHVSGGTNESLRSSAHVIPPMVFPPGYHVPLAAAFKEVLCIPVIAVGRLNTPELAERVLSDGKADLAAAGRAFLSDPHWPAKAAKGEADRIRQCVACNNCFWMLLQQKDLSCTQNAALGREEECQVYPAQESKKVFVIGGGPGGLEAARVARKRGHRVTLLEKNSHLGGQLLLASIPPHKQPLLSAVEWLIREVEREGVEVKLNTEGTGAGVEKEKPDAVIVATGSSPISPIAFSTPNVLTAWEVLAGRETGRQVLILGGGMVGAETAEFLAQKGCQVTVVEMLGELAVDMEGTTRVLLLERLAASKIAVMLSTKVEEVYEGRVRVTKDGKEQWLETETIVLALGSRPNRDLLRALEAKVPQLLAVGDCVEPQKAKEAIHEGFSAGLRVGSNDE